MSIITIDLDGTLINDQHKICDENIQAIQNAQNQGYEVVIATGRAYFDAKEILKKNNLSLYIIGANGATIHNMAGENLLTVPMPTGHVTRNIMQWLEEHQYYYEVFCEDGIYTPSYGREILNTELAQERQFRTADRIDVMEVALSKQLGQIGFRQMHGYQDFFANDKKIFNILVFTFDEEKKKRGIKKFKNIPNLTLVHSSPFNFELEHVDASKGNALVYLAKKLGIDLERSMAVGDSGNDVSMFKVVSDSFAMTNADGDIQKQAKYMTKNNNEQGVAHAIYQFLGKNK